MNRLTKYFVNLGLRRILMMALGNVFLGMGVSIFKLALLGNDAYNAMVMALAEVVNIPYSVFFIILGVGFFVIEVIFGREYVGIGTIFNTFLLGYIVTFFYNIWIYFFQVPDVLWLQIIVMLIGVIITSFGISMYQTPNAGVSPYDSMSLILTKYAKRIPYFWCRIFTDALCALVCFLAGGLVGIGTLACAFGLGPIVHFFNKNVSEKILAAGKKSRS